MISKELLSEVLGENIVYVQDYFELSEVIYETKNTIGRANKYELAFSIQYYLLNAYDIDLDLNQNVDAIYRDADTLYKGVTQ